LKEKNVLIPLWLFNDIIDLLDQWDISSYPENIRTEHSEIMYFLIEKCARLRLHDAYSSIVYANGDESRNKARKEYLERKYYHHLFSTRA